MRIAVAGGTGVVGRHVVEAAQARGHEAVVIARSRGHDLVTGQGLGQALKGVEAVIDVSNVTTTSEKKATAYFEPATRNLMAAGQVAGVGHHLVLSIVGADRVPFGYYRGKRRQEELALVGPVPATVLRATQFHEFPGQLLDRMKGLVAPIPRMRSQTVAASEVADHLVGLAEKGPQGMAAELAGPEVHDMADLARQVLRRRGRRRPVVSIRIPGEAGRRMAGGGLLPDADGPRGTITFADWLAATPHP